MSAVYQGITKFLVEIGYMLHDISHLYVQWRDTRRMVVFCWILGILRDFLQQAAEKGNPEAANESGGLQCQQC